MRKTSCYAFLFFLSWSLYQCQSSITGSTEILWDQLGVSHIFTQNEEERFYSYGWAQMTGQDDLILRLYGQAHGCTAGSGGSCAVPRSAEKCLRTEDLDSAHLIFRWITPHLSRSKPIWRNLLNETL